MERSPAYSFIKERVELEFERLKREKVTPWAFFLTDKGVRLTDFFGKQVSYTGGGLQFDSSPRYSFWNGFIQPFLKDIVSRNFTETENFCRDHRVELNQPMKETASLLKASIKGVYYEMSNIDQRLRGKGHPNSVPKYNPQAEIALSEAFVEERLSAELALKETKTLHEFLQNQTVTGSAGPIDLYNRFQNIKISAKEWLKDYDKNDFDHSERLEGYLNEITREPIKNSMLTPGEAFVLLCAVYMHDLGYMNNGKLDPNDHSKRSQEFITANPKKYHLDDFPSCDGEGAVYAIGRVCHGHSLENDCPLNSLENEFPDSALSKEKPLNIRKLTALLRLADEADDPYIRPKTETRPSIRNKTPLVTVEPGKIVWYWKGSGVSDPSIFDKHIKEKNKFLQTSMEYLRSINAGSWDLILRPPISMLNNDYDTLINLVVKGFSLKHFSNWISSCYSYSHRIKKKTYENAINTNAIKIVTL